MPRAPRLELAGVPLHVVQRGNNRAACFVGEADRHFYLKCLGEAAASRGCAVHARSGAVSLMMQDVGRRYVRTFNRAHQRTGTLWEGRYRSSLIDSERYLLACHRYIELNPVVTEHAVFQSLGRDPEERHKTYRALFLPQMEGTLLEHIRSALNAGAALGSRAFMEEVALCLRLPVREARPGRRSASDESQALI